MEKIKKALKAMAEEAKAGKELTMISTENMVSEEKELAEGVNQLAGAYNQLKQECRNLESNLDDIENMRFERRTEALTGLRSREDMFEMLKDSLNGRRQMIRAMFMIDIDNFRMLNEHYGNTYGDECLQRIGTALLEYEKGHPITFYRYGGEEILGLAFSLRKNAGTIAKELVKLVSDLNIPRDDLPSGCVTVSVGYTGNNSRYEKMIDLADKALYQAKANGKNQAVCYEDM